jgi:hypothetical protein
VGLSVAVLAVLLALPAYFNVPGDKHKIGGRAVTGPVRISIELLLFASAVAGAVSVWPVWASAAIAVLVAVAIIANLPRWRWLVATTRG